MSSGNDQNLLNEELVHRNGMTPKMLVDSEHIERGRKNILVSLLLFVSFLLSGCSIGHQQFKEFEKKDFSERDNSMHIDGRWKKECKGTNHIFTKIGTAKDMVALRPVISNHCLAKKDRYSISVIEFDDVGMHWDRRQLTETKKEIKRIFDHQKEGVEEKLKLDTQGLQLFIFVHGWRHNASENSKHLIEFRNMVREFAKNPPCFKEKKADCEKLKKRHVLGVYIGWRGESLSLKLPTMIAFPTFWSRKSASRRVASTPMTETLLELLSAVEEGDEESNKESKVDMDTGFVDSHTVIIGHSLGARVVEHAIAQAFIAKQSEQKQLFDGDNIYKSTYQNALNEQESDLKTVRTLLKRSKNEEARLMRNIDTAKKNIGDSDIKITSLEEKAKETAEEILDEYKDVQSASPKLKQEEIKKRRNDTPSNICSTDGLLFYTGLVEEPKSLVEEPKSLVEEPKSLVEEFKSKVETIRDSIWEPNSKKLEEQCENISNHRENVVKNKGVRDEKNKRLGTVKSGIQMRKEKIDEIESEIDRLKVLKFDELKEFLDTPADVVLLLNPATEAMSAKTWIDATCQFGYSGIRSQYLKEEFEKPWIISVTSEADLATRFLFPLGVFTGRLATLSAPARKMVSIQKGCDEKGEIRKLPQRSLLLRTTGNFELLRSHKIKESEQVNGRKYDIDRIDLSFNESVYWVASADRDIISSHGAIFNEKVKDLIIQLIIDNKLFEEIRLNLDNVE